MDQQENLDSRTIVNVIIAKDFNLAPQDIQIQGLEVCSALIPGPELKSKLSSFD